MKIDIRDIPYYKLLNKQPNFNPFSKKIIKEAKELIKKGTPNGGRGTP